MNILPKKSWHVRNKDNVERVRRDEERAAAAERELKARAELAEREARTDLLRNRARRSLPDPSEAPRDLELFGSGGQSLRAGSKELEAEKRQEKERRERALGILVALGGSASSAQTVLPWYEEVPRGSREGEMGAEERDIERKGRLDPLVSMKGLLRAGERRREGGRGGRAETGREGRVAPELAEGLRAERLRREARERERAEALLRAHSQSGQQEATPEPMDERKRAYNSQFHPYLRQGTGRR
ncbi:LOW QUALITY PROTEIN: leukocyte receptor cluster member 1 [Stegostoma tigrinum]|uniref:LOW QUALITY PROTEIN: leukocyte receptor cluster member 1 n=1 Tax=Stegostoma tigrinum TaxID=3053191 RepID=UPI0028700BE6|nr:LOW QUALITY PROTEIN: leukocyte receptor cluster member 1 [Stegostoma tigrinum]